jgi:hypothetical protein
MITEMDNLVNPGSDLVIAAALPEAEMQRRLYAGGIATSPCVRQDCFACRGMFTSVLMCLLWDFVARSLDLYGLFRPSAFSLGSDRIRQNVGSST